MNHSTSRRIAYVVKRYPRYSETFIVNEILAHEQAGLDIEIFALRPPADTHFQDRISRVRAPVTYLPHTSVRAQAMWSNMKSAAGELDGLWQHLHQAEHDSYMEVHQAVCLAREIKRRGITHLHAHFATSATAVARLAGLMGQVPYTLTAHAKDIFHESVDPDDLNRKLADAAAVVTVSDYNLDFLGRNYPDAGGHVHRIYNGLDLDDFRYESPAQRQPTIVAVGRLIPKKGFGTLVEACNILKQRGVPFRCDILGNGELEPELATAIAEKELTESVHLVGPRPQAEVIERVQSASVFAAPCVVGEDGNRDGLPTVLLEAMALGTPCVSTDVTGIPEVIRDRETGRMVAQFDATSLASAMAELLDDPQQRVQLARRARQLIERDFDIHQNAARIRRLFASCAGRNQDTTPARAETAVV